MVIPGWETVKPRLRNDLNLTGEANSLLDSPFFCLEGRPLVTSRALEKEGALLRLEEEVFTTLVRVTNRTPLSSLASRSLGSLGRDELDLPLTSFLFFSGLNLAIWATMDFLGDMKAAKQRGQ